MLAAYEDSQYKHNVVEQVLNHRCEILHATALPPAPDIFKSTWFTEFWTLLWRGLLINYKAKRIAITALISKCIMGLFIGAVYWQIPLNQIGVNNMKGVLFFFLAQMSIPACLGVIRTFALEYPPVIRENRERVYRVTSYFCSRVLSFIPVFSVDGFLALAIAYYMIGLRQGLAAFFTSALICLLVEQASMAFGTMLSNIAPTYGIALGLAGPLLTVTQIVAGMMVNAGTLPVTISWLQYLSLWRYGYEALCITQWAGVSSISCEGTVDGCLSSGEEILKSLSFSASNLWRNVGLLVVLTAGFYIVAGTSMWLRVKITVKK